MSDHAPDPIDKAYVQAEAVLSDEADRAARRARVLAAVAQAAPEAAPSAPRRTWARGGWLVAASVAGVSVLLATQVRPPIQTEPPPAPPAPTAAAPQITAEESPSAPPPAAKAPAQATPRPSRAPAAQPLAPAPVFEAPASEPAAPPAPAPAPPPPPPLPIPQVARARPEALPPAAAAPSPAMDGGLSELVVTGSRIPPGEARRVAAPAASPDRLATRLRDAAARGRTAEVSALLRRGVPVDAPDDEGETALMKAVRGNHPDAAALLRRQGASLDLRSQAGQSARDLAASIGDAELDRALGLER